MTTDETGAYFVSVPEMGRRLSLGRSLAYELVARGQIKVVRVGARMLVPVAEVERFAEQLMAETLSAFSFPATNPSGAVGPSCDRSFDKRETNDARRETRPRHGPRSNQDRLDDRSAADGTKRL